MERSGAFETVAFCEIDAFCRRVLSKHWPEVFCYDDVRTIPRIGGIDAICGGFPCQPFSTASAGKRYGADHDSYLWPAMLAVIDRERPAWVIGENVAGIDGMALEQVVSDLEAIGYDVAPPLEIPACGVGHDHWRPRIWFLAYADSNGEPVRSVYAEVARGARGGFDAIGSRKANGFSGGLDANRRRSLGNSVVPQIPELIGRAIAASMLEVAE
jgi:DNA (cytosine-5)-methyltransferase 1